MTLQEFIKELQFILESNPEKATLPVFGYETETALMFTIKGIDNNISDRIDINIEVQ